LAMPAQNDATSKNTMVSHVILLFMVLAPLCVPVVM